MKTPPYAQDPKNGQSRTRAFLEEFLESFFDVPGQDLPIYSTLYENKDSTLARRENVYVFPPEDGDLPYRYIGRASPTPAGYNPHEYLWCVTCDVALACKRLKTRSRFILAYKYLYGYNEHTISTIMGLHFNTVRNIVEDSLAKIADMLDNIQ